MSLPAYLGNTSESNLLEREESDKEYNSPFKRKVVAVDECPPITNINEDSFKEISKNAKVSCCFSSLTLPWNKNRIDH